MPKDFSRTERIAELIQREITLLIQQEIKDPRIPKIFTISEVVVTRDLGYAKVYYTLLGEQQNKDDCQKALEKASGFIRSQLAKRISLISMPKLTFIYDDTLQKGNRLMALIDELVDQQEFNQE